MASDAARPRANPRGFSPLTQQKRRSAKPLCRFWRKVRDYLRRHENKMAMTGRRLDGFGRCASSREPAGVLTPHAAKTAERKTALPLLAEGEGFEPPDACTSTVFKFYPAFVAFRLLLLFNSPNFRKISVLAALLFDNSGFLLCFGIVSRSLSLFIFSVFLTVFCRDFVDE